MRWWLCVLLLLVACRPQAAPVLQDGDIIFHTSRSAQSLAIQRATDSPYSHMGMIFLRDGKAFVFEAVQPVKYTPLEQWIARGEGGHYVVKRLKNADAVLTSAVIGKMRQSARSFVGKSYDLSFEWSDQRMYCSEIVWKIYDRVAGVQIGELQKVRDFDLGDPAVKAKMKERYGNNIPLDMFAISPGAMFESALLETVGEG